MNGGKKQSKFTIKSRTLWRCSLRDEAKELIAATERKSNTTQNDVTEKLGERVQNINYWKFELERGIQGKIHSYKTKQVYLIYLLLNI